MIGRGKTDAHFTDVFVSRAARASANTDTLCATHVGSAACFTLHRIEWHASRISADRETIVWHFRAPDAESVRIALRRAGIAFDEVWVDQEPGGKVF